MTKDERHTVEKEAEAALKRAGDRAKRDAQTTGIPLVRRQNGKLVEVRIEADGSETVVSETTVSE